MRHLLVDHARKKATAKRSAPREELTVDIPEVARQNGVELLAFHDALGRLSELDERKGRVVELRVFGGMTIDETAAEIGIAPVTVTMDWRFARAWFSREFYPD